MTENQSFNNTYDEITEKKPILRHFNYGSFIMKLFPYQNTIKTFFVSLKIKS